MADREDFLEEDAEIPGQKFVLLSFLSPEKVLANKNLFFFNKFLKSYEFTSRTKNLENFLVKSVGDINAKLDAEADKLLAADLSGAADICRASKIRVDLLMDSFADFVKTNEQSLRDSEMKEKFDDFMYVNKAKLEDEYFQINDFHTTVRGLKIRGVYGSKGEAEVRSKKLQRSDPIHNIFLGEVGKWLPWDPEPSDVQEQEYAEEQLNTLMKKYKENEEQREQFQREQRNRVKKAPGSEKPGITVVKDEVGAPVDAAVPTDAGGESFAEMFGEGGPADLAIARKMAAKKE